MIEVYGAEFAETADETPEYSKEPCVVYTEPISLIFHYYHFSENTNF